MKFMLNERDVMLSLRLGYNYLSPMFRENAYRDQSIGSNLVEHLSLERNALGQDYIKCRDTVTYSYICFTHRSRITYVHHSTL